MQNQAIKLTPLLDVGSGNALIEKNRVMIEVNGINGGLKAWLVGKSESVAIGNLVNGRLEKEVDTTNHEALLITQSGRQMFLGSYGNISTEEILAENQKDDFPNLSDGFEWQKITSRKFSTQNIGIKYILSHTAVYDNFLKYGYYWLGKKGNIYSVAFPCKEKDDDPFSFLNLSGNVKKGFSSVFFDEEKQKIYASLNSHPSQR